MEATGAHRYPRCYTQPYYPYTSNTPTRPRVPPTQPVTLRPSCVYNTNSVMIHELNLEDVIEKRQKDDSVLARASGRIPAYHLQTRRERFESRSTVADVDIASVLVVYEETYVGENHFQQ